MAPAFSAEMWHRDDGFTNNVCHDAELVQGGLPVEEYNVAVNHVPLDHVAKP